MKIVDAYQLYKGQIKALSLGKFHSSEREWLTLNVYPVIKEKIIGFGGALTHSSAHNFYLLNKDNREKVLEALVGEKGLRYNFFRLCIGSSDFATHSYDYIDENDQMLSTFSIEEDKKELIPFIKEMLGKCVTTPYILASSWSAPAFMKDSGDRLHGGHLKKEYYSLYAEYITKYIEAYRKEGIVINGLTIQNEPKAKQTWESCVFTQEEELEFAKVLSDKLKERRLNIDLFAWDHNKERLFERADYAFSNCDIFKGAAFHWYSGDHFEAIEAVHKKYPTALIIETEFCRSIGFDETNTSYTDELIGNLSHGANGICEWNVILDENGGPYHDRGNGINVGCDAPIRINKISGEFILSDIYKEMYMFSHFIDKNAVSLYASSNEDSIRISAVLNPNKLIIINIVNRAESREIKLRIEGECIDVPLIEKSSTVLVIKK